MEKKNITKEFEKIYQKTYYQILKYIICKCHHLEDVNDLVQDSYVELYKRMQKQNNNIENVKAYLIGIVNNLMKKYYEKENKITVYPFIEEKEENVIDWKIDLERDIVTKENVVQVWKYLKNKDITIAKIFYLHYTMDMKIIDISKALEIGESNVKNYLYRTLKELKNVFGKEGDDSGEKF